MSALRRLLSDNRGASAIEYGLLASFVALGIVTSVQEVGSSLADGFGKAETGFEQGGKGPKKDKDDKKDKDEKKGGGKK